jgi:hypothetical protein
MKHRLLLLLLSAVSLLAENAAGTWRGTLTPEEGDAGPALLILTVNGNNVTGTAGPNEGERIEIANGKVSGDKVSFDVNAGKATLKFKLTLKGDELNGDATRELGERTQRAKLVLKREK